MPGMMFDSVMKALEAALGNDFQARWVDMLSQHHVGALETASTGTDDGEDKKARSLATAIVMSQRTQVKAMQGLSR